MTNKISFILLLLLTVILTSCDKASDPPDSSIASNETDTISAVPTPTKTTTPIPPSPTTTMPPTPLPTIPEPPPSQTPFPTDTATPTPWPTLPPDEAVNQVLALLQDNQNPDCLLPCWWGAIPGQTYWSDISPYLSSFALRLRVANSPLNPNSVAFVTFSVPENIDYLENLNLAYGINASKIVTGIRVWSVNIAGYDPWTMMTLYGIPDEVWLRTLDYYIGDNILPFRLIIVYQEKGISFNYYVNATVSDGIVTRCFEPGVVETERLDLFAAGPEIRLWEPGPPKTLYEITMVPEAIYLPLEETTDLTPRTFYEKFTDPNQSPCIETPANLWDF